MDIPEVYEGENKSTVGNASLILLGSWCTRGPERVLIAEDRTAGGQRGQVILQGRGSTGERPERRGLEITQGLKE